MAIKANLLLVDDEPDILELWKVHFPEERFEIFEATSGEQALEVVNRIAEDADPKLLIVLLDVKMPGLDGLQVLEEIKARVPAAKIFIITGNVEGPQIPNTAYTTGRLGGDGFYEKSKIDFDDLKKQIDDFIEEEKQKFAKINDIKKALEKLGARVDVELPYQV